MLASHNLSVLKHDGAFNVTVLLAGGATMRFRCIGSPQIKTKRWRLDLATSLDPVPDGLVLDVSVRQQRAVIELCSALTDELAAVLECRVTRVQPDLLDLEKLE